MGDEGKTEDDQKCSDAEHQKTIELLRDEERKAFVKMVEDEREVNRSIVGPPKKEGFHVKRIRERDQVVYDLLQYFDRPRGLQTQDALSRDALINALVCAEDRTFGEAAALTTIGGSVARST